MRIESRVSVAAIPNSRTFSLLSKEIPQSFNWLMFTEPAFGLAIKLLLCLVVEEMNESPS